MKNSIFFLVFIGIVIAENPFLPVQDAPIKSNDRKSGNSKVVIREKSIIQIRPGVSGDPIPIQSSPMLIGQGLENQSSNSRLIVIGSEEKESERIALIPTPLIRDPSNRLKAQQQQQNGNQEASSEMKDVREFFLTRNSEGNLVLFANSPLPKNGLIVMMKSPNGTRKRIILKPAGHSNNHNQDNQNGENFNLEPIKLSIQGDEERKDSAETLPRIPPRNFAPKPRNVVKISRDGTFVKLNQPQKIDLNDLESKEDSDLIWSPTAGIRATIGKTPEEQWKKDEEQRMKLQSILREGNGKKLPSNPQPPVLVVSDIDPSHPRPILVHSDPDPFMPQPVLVDSQQDHQNEDEEEDQLLLDDSSQRGQSPPILKEESTETVAKTSNQGMRIEIPESNESIEDV